MKITDKLIKQVANVAHIEMQIKLLKEELEPAKKKLGKKIPYGVFEIGEFQVVKTKIDACTIAQHNRKEYDQLTIK